MCLLDTTDGALMFSLYVQPATNFLLPPKQATVMSTTEIIFPERSLQTSSSSSSRDIIAFLYYSIVLTTLTVMVAIVIGVIQLLTMVASVANPQGKFWDGVQTVGDYYDAIGGGICGCFVVVGILSVFAYKPWKRWVSRSHGLADEEEVREEEEEGRGGYQGAGDIFITTSRDETQTCGGVDPKGAAGSHISVEPAAESQQ